MSGIGSISAVGRPAVAGTFLTPVMRATASCNLDGTRCCLPDRRSRRLMTIPVAEACAASIEQLSCERTR